MHVCKSIYIYVSLSLQWNDRFVKRKPLRPQQVNESTQPQRADEKLRRNEVPDIHELSKFGIGLGEVEDTLRWLGTVDAWHNGSPKIIGCYCMLLCVAIYCYVYNIYIYIYIQKQTYSILFFRGVDFASSPELGADFKPLRWGPQWVVDVGDMMRI